MRQCQIVLGEAVIGWVTPDGGSFSPAGPLTPETPTLDPVADPNPASEQKAVELAKKELASKGLKVDDYRVTVTTSSSGEDWLVIFDLKVHCKPGGGYWATVDKFTGKVIFGAGD